LEKLTAKQERFARFVFEGCGNTEAWEKAGYSMRGKPSVIWTNACRLAQNTNVALRIKELNDLAVDASVSTVLERKQILTEIQRARVGSFTDEHGNVNITDASQLLSAALQEIRTDRTASGGIRTTLKLRDPVAAIAEHNKMDGVYSEEKGNITNNTQINIFVKDIETKDLIERVSERLQKYP